MIDLPDLSIAALLDAYRAGRRTPSQTALAVIDAVAAYADPAVWISRASADELLARAAALEADPEAISLPLYGVPFAVKDNMDAVGHDTTAGCPAFAYRPDADATVVQRLLAAGAMLVGKTNLDQFATGLVGTRSPYGAPRCVFDADYISGGSSSGSAVAVAAGLVSFALGTDTAGSGRVPAGFNNIVGLKPTRGLVSTAGIVPACRSIDCVSIFAQTAIDALAVLGTLQGEDEHDPYSRTGRPQPLPLEDFRFGVLAEADRVFCGDAEAEALYDDAIARMRRLGGTPVAIEYGPFRNTADLLYGGPHVAERLAAIEPFVDAHAAAMDPVVRGIIESGRAISATDAYRGQYRLRALAQATARQWRGIDLMLLPTSPTIFTVAAVQSDPLRLNSMLGLYTNFVNLLDYAAIAVPAGFRPNGLPAGVTLIGPAFSDEDLARLGGRLHHAVGCGSGTAQDAVLPGAASAPTLAGSRILVAVAGAHLRGMTLHHQLIELDAVFVEALRTAPEYRLMALSGTIPPKPALVRTRGFTGAGIEIELWALGQAEFGHFAASLPSPMGIGKIRLQDGRMVSGFLCEPYAIEDAADISHYGGWRSYVAEQS